MFVVYCDAIIVKMGKEVANNFGCCFCNVSSCMWVLVLLDGMKLDLDSHFLFGLCRVGVLGCRGFVGVRVAKIFNIVIVERAFVVIGRRWSVIVGAGVCCLFFSSWDWFCFELIRCCC